MARTDMGSQRRFTRPKSDGFSGGFTIIEVILFLAISGLLLAGAMAGVSANINNTRFNDAIQSTTSYIQQQFDEVASGKNDRATGLSCDASLAIGTMNGRAPGMTNCVILGRYIRLQGADLDSRYIVGYASNIGSLVGDDTDTLNQLLPVVASSQTYASTYEVPWNIAIAKSKIPSGTPTSLGLAIVRSPASGNILTYTFNANGDVEPSLSGVLTAANLNKKATVCFDSGGLFGRKGNVIIGAGQGQEVIQADLSSSAGDCS